MASGKTLRVALAQTCPISGEPAVYPSHTVDPFRVLHDNLAEVEVQVKKAKDEGAEVVCFAEYFLQGILNEGRQYLSLPSRHLEDAIAELARKYSIAITGTIVHGSSSTLPAPPPVNPFGSTRSETATEWTRYTQEIKEAMGDTSHLTLLNEAFFIDAEGKRRGSYVKKNLWHPEREYLDPGKDHYPVFDTPWGKAGFLICWDLSHPAAAQDLVKQGADIIFAPSYWLAIDSEPMASKYTNDPDYELKVVQALAYARCFETETVLVHTNPGGPREEGFMGGSGVWAPLRGKVGGFEKEQVGLEIVNIDLAVIQDGRETYKIREDADARQGDARV